ncbi:hypothetical protein NL676_031771 [Syzygium grande]|nr:hypothetical protein NL676_031771 [Syzygium grande]
MRTKEENSISCVGDTGQSDKTNARDLVLLTVPGAQKKNEIKGGIKKPWPFPIMNFIHHCVPSFLARDSCASHRTAPLGARHSKMSTGEEISCLIRSLCNESGHFSSLRASLNLRGGAGGEWMGNNIRADADGKELIHWRCHGRQFGHLNEEKEEELYIRVG